MSHIKNIIFDLDGTLIDSSDGVVEAVNYSLKMMNEPIQPSGKIKTFIGYPLSEMYPHFSKKPVKELYKHFQVKAAETVVSSTVMLPNVEIVLTTLSDNNYRFAIATTKIKKHVEGIIEKFGWQKIFHSYAGGDEVNNVKPAPDIFKLILERMDAEIEETVVVGDTENDIIAAQTLSLPTIGVKSPYDNSDKVKSLKPDYFIDSIKELPETLARFQIK